MLKWKPDILWKSMILLRIKKRKMDGYAYLDWEYPLTPVQRAWLEETERCTVRTVIPMFEEDCYEHIEFPLEGLRKEWSINLWWAIQMHLCISKRKKEGYNFLDWKLPFTPVQKAWLEETEGCTVETVIPMFEEECYEHIMFAA